MRKTILLLTVILSAIFVSAQTTWNGSTSTDWNTGTNWSTGIVPTLANAVIIPSGTPNKPTIGAAVDAACDHLTVNTGATLTVQTTATNFDINGNADIDGTLTNTGNKFIKLKQTNGTLGGNGDMSTCHFKVIVPYDLVTNIAIRDLDIANGDNLDMAGFNLTLSGNIKNQGDLIANGGTLTLNGTSLQKITGDNNDYFDLQDLIITNTTTNAKAIQWDPDVRTTIASTLFMSMPNGGDFDLNGAVINLGTTGSISGESSDDRIYDAKSDYLFDQSDVFGAIKFTVNLSTVSTAYNDIAGTGLSITTGAGNTPGSTVILRSHAPRSGDFSNQSEGIELWYFMTSTTNTSLDLTIKIEYFDSDLTGHTSNSDMSIFRSDDAAYQWWDQFGTWADNGSEDYVTITGIDAFDDPNNGISENSYWTVSNAATSSMEGYVWDGDIDTDWDNAANWSRGVVPTEDESVIIPSGTPFAPTIDATTNAQCAHLRINSGATLTCAAIDASGGRFEIGGGIDVDGTLNHTGDRFIGLKESVIWYDEGLFIDGDGDMTTCYYKLTGNYDLAKDIAMKTMYTGTSNHNIDLAGHTLTLTGDLHIDGSFTHSNGTVIMSGSSVQYIDSENDFFYNLILTNTTTNAEAVKVQTTDITIVNTLTMSMSNGGDLNLNGQTITLETNASIVGESSADRIYGTSGKITHTINMPSNATAYNDIAGMGISITTGAGNTPGTTVIERAHDIQSGTGLSTSVERWFDITPTINTALDVTLEVEYFDAELNGLASNSNMTLYRSTDVGVTWTDETDTWTDNGTEDYLTKTGVTAFSRWTANNPVVLPIELTHFDAGCQNDNPELSWSTASEINNDYFTIERSTDAINFEPVGTINGHGNSNTTLNYMWTDDNPFSGTTYYRLKQTDFNGAFEYHGVRSVSCEQTSEISIYPNPFQKSFTVQLSENTTYPITVEVIDYLGRTIHTKVIESTTSEIVLDDNISKGTYFVRVFNETTHIIERIVKMN